MFAIGYLMRPIGGVLVGHIGDTVGRRAALTFSVAAMAIPAGRLRGSRNKLSEEVICALLRDFREHGQKAIARVRREQPGVYLRVLALLCPREHKVEHSNALKNLSDEQLEAMIEYLETSLEAQAGGPVNVIEATAEPTGLPAPTELKHLQAKRSNPIA